MSERVILICDDEAGRRDEWKEALEGLRPTLDGWVVELLGSDFADELQTLKDRELASRTGELDRKAESRFDAAQVLVVDYDLLQFEGSGWVTGENVAYLARCYSTCEVIVGVNLTGQENPFDLTLVDHLDSFADVNIGAKQLTNPGLWGGPRSGLSPWSWPSLPNLVDAHRQRVVAVGDGGTKLLDALGLRDVGLPRHARQLIEAGGERDPTFEEFARDSDLGLRGGDKPWQGTTARVAAARAAKWLETAVLPAQDLLIDAPHLAVRNPLLLAGAHDDPNAWERTTDRGDPSGALIPALCRHSYGAPLWANRPLWRWAPLGGDTELPGVAEPWERPSPPYVFCEDISRFLPPEHARDFVVDDLPTSLPTRYVAKQGDPAVKELVGDDLSSVQYGPKTRFAL